jgi:hypothetical protein
VRKITGIILKSTGILLIAIFILAIVAYFGIRSYTVQTWLGHKATLYLSAELKSTIQIDAIQLDFFEGGTIKGILIKDQQNDTLFYGQLTVHISNFEYKKHTLVLDKLELSDGRLTIQKLRHDSVMNYEFLVDYFSSDTPKDTTSATWDIRYRTFFLNNVSLHYHLSEKRELPPNSIDFDYIDLNAINGSIEQMTLSGDTIRFKTNHLAFHEKSGFTLEELTTHATISPKGIYCDSLKLRTPLSKLEGTIGFQTNEWKDYADFINAVQLKAKLLDSSHVHSNDIAFFVPELFGLNQKLFINGLIRGAISDLRLKDVNLKLGNHTQFKGNFDISGLPDIKTAYIHFSAKHFSTCYEDFSAIPTYPFNSGQLLQIPAELSALGVVDYSGKFDGFITDFTTYGTIKTALGNLSTQLSIRPGKANEISYHGKFQTDHFNVGKLVASTDLNDLSLNCEINGSGITLASLNAKIDANILGATYNNYHYKQINMNGRVSNRIFNGNILSRDPNANFDFNGIINFAKESPEADFIATINRLQLSELNFTNKADSGALSTQMLINMHGTNLDNLTGQIHFDGTEYQTRTRKFKLNTFNIQADQSKTDKRIRLTSEYINAFVRGKFNLTSLKPAFESLLYSYYPTYFQKPSKNTVYKDSLMMQVSIKKFNTIRDLFLPEVMMSPGTLIEGTFDAFQNKLNLQFTSRLAEYNSIKCHDLLVILNENKNTVLAEASGRMLSIGDSLEFKNFNLVVNSLDSKSGYMLDWDNLTSPANKGSIQGALQFDSEKIQIVNEKLKIVVRDSLWQQEAPAEMNLSKNGLLDIHPFKISNNQQWLGISGRYSSNPADSLNIRIGKLQLHQFNPALHNLSLQLQGELNANVKLAHEEGHITVDGDLSIINFVANDNVVGALEVKTSYNPAHNKLRLSGFTSLGLKDPLGNQIKNIDFAGFYYFDKKEEPIDITITANPANIKLLNPLLEGILTIKNGYVKGQGKVHGSPENIKIDGNFTLFNTEVKVDYSNVSYEVTGGIEVMPDQIRFTDLLMREKGSRSVPHGTINGNIFHTNFSKMQIDYDVTYNNLLVLNTTEKENGTFYGKIYSSGNVGIYGFLNDLHMVITNTTTGNSNFYMPLDGPAQVDENDFIHFVVKDTSNLRKETEITGFDLTLNLYATPSATAHIILDKRTGDQLTANGRGLLNLRINTFGKFEMYGDYILSGGDYVFTLENVIRKKFEIEPGSRIGWSGSPMNADIDVITSYKQRVSVAPLINNGSTGDKSRTPVDCQLLINGKLFSPAIRFKIDFPNLDANTKASIDNVLSDEAELNRQVFSFLLFRSFISPLIYNVNGGGVTAGVAAASTGSELLSNRVSEFLNTYVGNLTGLRDLQLGLNYKAGSGVNNSDAVDIALSKQFLNNKISVDGNIGVNSNKNQGTGTLIGDVNIDYKLSEDGRYRLKGFNRTNDVTQLAVAGGPYTQGIGFFYRREFESINQLFSKWRNKARN